MSMSTSLNIGILFWESFEFRESYGHLSHHCILKTRLLRAHFRLLFLFVQSYVKVTFT